jgi:uncharacterized protein YfaS (alpha-2-macroglobulin family)
LKLTNTKERRWVAVTDPLPAGLEPVESWFATTATDLRRDNMYEGGEARDWTALWRRGGYDFIERHDDRVNLFATRLSEGTHVFSYLARATTAGTFNVAPTHAEEMYEPEVFGRSKGEIVEVNQAAVDSPEMINKDPHGEAWLVVVKLTNPTELEGLLSVEDYQKYVEEEAGN